MIKTPLSTVIGGAFWTPGCTVISSMQKTLNQLIKSLFANNEVGFAYDPNDLTTLYQDAAGTIPVTAAGQPVGLVLDKSGRNNHAFQSDSASRPILRQNSVTGAYYLEFDGSDDFFVTNSIDFTSTDKISLFTGVRKLSDAERAAIIELSSLGGGNNGSFSIEAWRTLTPPASYASVTKGTSVSVAGSGKIQYPAPSSVVLSVKFSISTNINDLSINGSLFRSIQSQGTGNYGNYPLYIGRRGGATLPFNGHIYGLIGVGKLVSDSETAPIEKELAKRLGVTLNV